MLANGGRVMTDLISRQAAIELANSLKDDLPDDERIADTVMAHNEGILEYQTKLSLLPSAQPEIIRCKDCRWWDKYSETQGYCMAAKHGYYSSHWEIHIRRIYGEDFFCADAEPIEEEEEEHGLDR